MIADLKPYADYKDSGLPWLGQVPMHWQVKRAKSIFGRIDQRSTTGQEELLTVSSARGIVPRKTANVTMFKAESYLGYKLCWPGDLVINSLWAWAGGLGVSKHHGIVSSAYGVYRVQPDAQMLPGFVHEVVRSSSFNWELRVRSKGVWISRLQLTDISFLDAPIHIPPLAEQAAIVRFLDWANGRLEQAIRAKRKVIALLNEQKQAIIHRTVTRGLAPSVPLKPSGIPWLGNIPTHWEIARLKFVASEIVDCLHATPRYSEAGTYPAIRTADIATGAVHLHKAKKISSKEYARWTQRLEPIEDDILYSREGERFGIAACVPAGTRLCISQRMMVFRISSAHYPRFVMWLLNSGPIYGQALQDVIGAAAPHVNISTIRNFFLAMPSRDEQKRITHHIESELRPIHLAETRIEREIELLREYRTRLVADVVTGKLDVGEAAARLPDEASPDISQNDVEFSDEIESADEEAVV
jgi:type I restriction enzyme S subunit